MKRDGDPSTGDRGEARDRAPGGDVEAAWIALSRAGAAVRKRIEAALKARGHPPLEWYDVLWELDRTPAGRLRQSQLGERLLFERYNLSRRLDRMQAAGLIERRACAEDSRGVDVHITPRGRALRARVWRDYARALDEHVGKRLTGGEARRLAALLRKLE